MKEKENDMIFKSNGDGTCDLEMVVEYSGEEMIIPSVSPTGEKVIGIKKIWTEYKNKRHKYKKVVIPDGVEYLFEHAFITVSIDMVIIPKSLKQIYGNPFRHSNVKKIIIDPNNEYYYSEGNCLIERKTKKMIAGTKYSIIPNNVSEIGDSAFEGLMIKDISIPNSVKTIGSSAFFRCQKLENISIPNSVKTIGRYAFEYCENLKNINLPEDLENISNFAFANSGLESIFIPKNVSSIKVTVFSQCYKLKKIEVDPENKRYYSKNNCLIEKETEKLIAALYNLNLEIPNGVKIISSFLVHYDVIFNSSISSKRKYGLPIEERISSIVIPETVEIIESKAFQYTNIKKLFIPKNVKCISDSAFSTNIYLESLVVDKDNDYYYSEGNCIIEKATKKIVAATKNSVIPEGVVEIPEGTFHSLSTIEKIRIPESVKIIRGGAFEFCDSLRELYVPKNLEVFEETLLSDKCKIYYGGTEEEWDKLAPWYKRNKELFNTKTKIFFSNNP